MCRFLAVSIAILWAVVKWEDKALQNGTGRVGRVPNALSSYQETDMESMDAPIRMLASSWEIKGEVGSFLDLQTRFLLFDFT